jgi:hypothetical protein
MSMRSGGALFAVGLVLAGCAPEIPDSAAGVGFDSYQGYQASRQAELTGRPAPVPAGPVIASETAGTISFPAATGPTATATTTATGATVDTNNPGISDEQNFDAVSARESIQSDAERIAANREAYVVIQPTSLPERPGGGGPNIVSYALATNHPVGTQLYPRTGLNAENRFLRACGSYASSDLAQEDFLARGGPERDRLGVDPDGDGYACYWDPTPFRAARAGGG